jgi:hypothetical protein
VDLDALRIVSACLQLRRSHPRAPARDILDLVVENKLRSRHWHDFGEWRYPPNEFGIMLAEASGYPIDLSEWPEPGPIEQTTDGRRARAILRSAFLKATWVAFEKRYGATPRPMCVLRRPGLSR